jgi:hypothetical protein
MLDRTIDDVEIINEVVEKRHLYIEYKDGTDEMMEDFDIYGANSGVLILGYADGSYNHINLDIIKSFKYFITKE